MILFLKMLLKIKRLFPFDKKYIDILTLKKFAYYYQNMLIPVVDHNYKSYFQKFILKYCFI